MLLRLSAILFPKRIFIVKRDEWAPFKIASAVLVGLSVSHGVATLLQIFFICRPLAAAWDPNAQCVNETLAYVTLEVVGLFIDLGILILPFPPI